MRTKETIFLCTLLAVSAFYYGAIAWTIQGMVFRDVTEGYELEIVENDNYVVYESRISTDYNGVKYLEFYRATEEVE